MEIKDLMHPKASYSNRIIVTAIAVIAMGVTAAISFQVRELAAALLIFSAVFGTIGISVLLLVLVEELALRGIVGIATALAHLKRAAHPVSQHAHFGPPSQIALSCDLHHRSRVVGAR